MEPTKPDISVVIATFNRARRLGELLAALRAQTYPHASFEVIVVDDASRDETPETLQQESEGGELHLRVIRRPVNGGRARARQDGWRTARGELIAFTDDDCVPDPGWLAAGVSACQSNPGAIVQGRTEPIAEELVRTGNVRRAFARTVRVSELDAGFQTCNVFYPRSVLERVGGFDTQAYERVHGGEDSDLAWRAIEAGAGTAFTPEARVGHAVNQLGPLGKLRLAATWEMKAYVRHPELRRAHFFRGIFWKLSHYLLLRALLAAVLPRRWRAARAWLATPYARLLLERGRVEGGGPLLAPYFVLYDLVEVVATVRAAVRYRTPML